MNNIIDLNVSDSQSNNNTSNNNLSIQNRKFAKTCVEKKRRDRINKCLDQLKEIMSQADDKARYQKMEKAEILEMAVAYMRNQHVIEKTKEETYHQTDPNHQPNQQQSSQKNLQYYSLAYRQCLNEFQSFLANFPGVQEDFKANLMAHMSQRYMDIFAYAQSANQSQTNINIKHEVNESYEQNCLKSKTKAAKLRNSPYFSSSLAMKTKKRSKTDFANDSTEVSSSSSSSSSSSTSSEYNRGSSSSLDQFNNNNTTATTMDLRSPESPCGSDSSSILNESINASIGSSSSACSSPTNSNSRQQHLLMMNEQTQAALAALNFANLSHFYQDCLMKVWRPW